MAKQGGLEVLHRLPVHERAMKTAPFLRGSVFISLVEVSPAQKLHQFLSSGPTAQRYGILVIIFVTYLAD